MRASTEPSGPTRGPLDADWRSQTERRQQAVLPSGSVLVSCPAPFGVGGLGRHLDEIVAALDRSGEQTVCVCGSTRDAEAEKPGGLPHLPSMTTLLAPAMRLSPSWRHWRTSVAFDRSAAGRLTSAEHLIAFNGTSLAQLRKARQMRFGSVSLMAANSHMRHVIRQHDLAYRQYPLERPWATRLLRRNLREYELAESIYVASRYTRESFLEEGFSEERLRLFPLTPHPRFSPGAQQGAGETFDLVYAGSLTVNKGVALLVDAFGRLGHRDMRLVLVGGWKTPGMRRFISQACARDPRITVRPGDHLPDLRAARLFVHPAYEDGFAYAPAEALACGVPVLVSEDTGMKDLIDPGVTGMILPTGELGTLIEAIESAYRGEAFGR